MKMLIMTFPLVTWSRITSEDASWLVCSKSLVGTLSPMSGADPRCCDMKRTLQLLLLLGLITISTGCASPYMVDRGRDAADIFTATVGYGVGVKAQVGPIQTGLFANRDYAGLRGGIFEAPGFTGRHSDYLFHDIDLLLYRYSMLQSENRLLRDRHKDTAPIGFGPITYLFWGHKRPKNVPRVSFWESPVGWLFDGMGYDQTPSYYHYTQIEVAVGVGPSIRLGFNPGELLDFLLGWFTIDIYSDDLEWKKRKSNEREESS